MVGTRRSLRIQQKSESEASDINTDDESNTLSVRKKSIRNKKASCNREKIPAIVEEEVESIEVAQAIRTRKNKSKTVQNDCENDQVINSASSINEEKNESGSTTKRVRKKASNKQNQPKTTKEASLNKRKDIIKDITDTSSMKNDHQNRNTSIDNDKPEVPLKKSIRRPRKSVIKEIQVVDGDLNVMIKQTGEDIIVSNDSMLSNVEEEKIPIDREIRNSLDEGVSQNCQESSDIIDSGFIKLSGTNSVQETSSNPTGAGSSDLEKHLQCNTLSQMPTFKFKLKLDLNKYNTTKTKGSSLLKLGNELKNNLPLKAHLQNLKESNKDSNNFDTFALDGTKLDVEVTERKEPVINAKLSETDTSTSSAIKQAANQEVKSLMKKSVLPSDMEKEKNCPKFHVSKHLLTKEKKKKAEETAGPGWYNLPRTEITEEIKKDLQIIKMRGTLDSKQHYKRSDSKKFPKFFQMGTIVEGAHEFYSGRLSKKDRKRTMVDELLADAEFRKKNKKRMIEYQMRKGSGGKGYYKKKIEKRKPTHART